MLIDGYPYGSFLETMPDDPGPVLPLKSRSDRSGGSGIFRGEGKVQKKSRRRDRLGGANRYCLEL
jgi:hypothetical protein